MLTISNLMNWISTGSSKVKLSREAALSLVSSSSSSTKTSQGPFLFIDPET